MSKLDKLNLSKDELDRFSKAMDDPAFRSLLQQYTEELSNPANRAEQEQYLREVEARAKEEGLGAEGGEVHTQAGGFTIPKGSKLISPTPVLCIKIVVPPNAPRVVAKGKPAAPAPTGPSKIFINLCTVDALNDVSSAKVDGAKAGKGSAKGNGGNPGPGTQVSLPYSLSAPRPCADTSGAPASAYDFVFSEASWQQYGSHPRYVDLFSDMALEAVLEREGVVATGAAFAELKTSAIRLRNTTFKGGKPPPRLFKVPEDKLQQEQQQPKKEESKTQQQTAANGKQAPAAPESALTQLSSKPVEKPVAEASVAKADPRVTPSYQLIHRGFFDISQTGSAASHLIGSGSAALLSELAANRPKELVLKVSLPLLQKVSDVNLDQAERQVLLSSADYFLLVALPFPVRADRGAASWSSKTKTLTVTMEVADPTAEEVEAFRTQRKPLEDAQQRRETERQESMQREKEEQERIRAQEEEAQRKQREEKRQAEEAATAAAAASAAASASSAASVSPSVSSASAPLHSVLKTSPSSSDASSDDGHQHVEKHVRFSLDASDGFIVPERDGPHGPKPVGLLHPTSASLPVPEVKGKGHRRKHVPGAEGPPTWTGVGVEPEKRLREAFPADRGGPLSPASQPASPSLKAVSASPKVGPTAVPASSSVRLCPSYTYSQSGVSVVLVIKVKGVAADSVQFHLEDAAGGEPNSTSTRMDLYFSTSGSPKKHYRLFLPLCHAVNIAKSNFSVTPQNMLVNLVKLPAASGSAATGEWAHLADWRALGEQFDLDGSWVGASPAPSPAARATAATVAQQGALEELSLGEAHGSNNSASGSSLVELLDDASATAANERCSPSTSAPESAKPLAPLQPLPSLAASSLLNPLITTVPSGVAASSAPSISAAVTAAHSSLLFQLD